MAGEADMPSQIERYEIVELLGRGAMGEVYLARDPRLEREVALKVLPSEYAEDGERLERFRREARIASGLNHPHICTIHDIGDEAGRPFIVMELVEGETLAPGEARRLPLDRVFHVGGQVARALAAAHSVGIVHRDIKPGNVMVRDDGYAKVVDFGLARTTAGAMGDDENLTQSGVIVGTVRYMSPEQARGLDLDGATDVFSLGVLLYELATGTHPFQADSQAELIQAILSHTAVSADRLDPQIPHEIVELLQRMLTQDSSLRPSAEEVATALEATHGGRPLRAEVHTREVAAPHTVGRRDERTQLLEAFDEAARGRGLFVCVTGEPGIGKTTLMEDFLAELGSTGRACSVARGRCSERLAGTEAYLPVLEALEGLLRSEGGDAIARTMKSVAPNWYAQVAPLADDDSSLARTLRESGGLSQERLKRELRALVLELSGRQAVVLLLDDIHWADASTVDLLAYLGAHCEAQHALLLLSYRPTDLALAKHPFGALKLDLQARGLCREVPLGFLTREDVAQYVDLECSPNDFPEALVDLLHTRTEGSPLFMADLLRYLRDRGVLVKDGERWTLGRSLPDLAGRLPESVRSMVQRKVEQLKESELALLVAASVQGYEFDAAVVAHALGLDPAEVEDQLAALERVHTFVSEIEERELPDRTLTLRYRFVHVLYQNTLYATLRPARRAALSRSVAEALLRHHGEDNSLVAAELALLCESARDFERATHYFLLAARHAVRLFANHEAAKLARRGLDLIETMPASEERDRRELALLVTLGPPLKDTKGWLAPEVVEIYSRANELGERIVSTPDLFPALWGMWMSYSSTADIETLRTMGKRLLAVAEESGDAGHLVQAHHALVTTHFMAGDFVEALRHGDVGRSLYDPDAHGEHAFIYGGHDPGSCCASHTAQCLWMLGYSERSLELAETALAMAEKRGHPVSMGLSYYSIGVLHQMRRDAPAARKAAEACERITLDQGAPIFPAFLLAWVRAEEGEAEAGHEQIRVELANLGLVPVWWQAYLFCLQAQVLGKAERYAEALASVDEVRRVIGDRQLGTYMAELHRFEGVFLQASSPAQPEAAESAIRRAIEIARRQEARMLELRATVSLGHLLAAEGRAAEVRPMLTELHGWFTEGLDTRDLQDARTLLELIS